MKKSFKKFALITLSMMTLSAVAPAYVAFAEGEETTAAEETAAEETAAEESAEESEGEETAAAEESAAEETAAEGEEAEEAAEGGIVLKQIYAAPHGDKSFASVVVAMQGDKILDAVIDEYQFVDAGEWKGVPNADGAFAEAFAEGKTLVSKRQDSELYSKMMAEKAGSTVSIADNLDAIGDFAKGKTTAELEETIKELEGLGEDGNVADVITGATLKDAGGYLGAIVQAANEGYEFAGAETLENADVEIKHALAAPHGDKAFALVTVVMDGDKVAATTIDEFQTVEGEGWTGVPNMDGAFAEGLQEGKILVSKLMDSETYSKLMAEKAGSTVTYVDNLKAISQFTIGKTVDELSTTVADLEAQGEEAKIADVISGATLKDAGGYLQAVIDVANQ